MQDQHAGTCHCSSQSLRGREKGQTNLQLQNSRSASGPEVKVLCTHSCLHGQRLVLVFDQGPPTDGTAAPDVANLPREAQPAPQAVKCISFADFALSSKLPTLGGNIP